MNKATRCGFVAIIGKPNVGKSTLLNNILGKKISITSRKPQTTRHRILGIKTQDDVQVIYTDTPGLHERETHHINRVMNRAALGALHDVNVVLWLVEADRWDQQDAWVLQHLEKSHLSTPVILVINKIDRLKDRAKLLPFIEKMNQRYSFYRVIPLSAARGTQVPELETEIRGCLPLSPFCFPPDQVTNRDEQFIAAEVIREKLMRNLGEELPYALTVAIEAWADEKEIIRIAAIIWVDKESQKGIVIGEKGATLKKIGTQARLDLEKHFAKKVFLQLWVKVKSGWADDERALQDFGYETQQ